MAFALEKHDEDFGQTLAHWGVDRGPYLVLPFLGPSTVREGFAGITNLYFNPGFNTSDSSKRNRFIGLSGISARADLLQFEDLIIGDEYLFNRGVYLQHLNFREGKEESYIEFSEFE
jgi:phospholipid-binding lipoprotein MlaA